MTTEVEMPEGPEHRMLWRVDAVSKSEGGMVNHCKTPNVFTTPPCPHKLGLNCLKCYPKQWHLTNARLP